MQIAWGIFSAIGGVIICIVIYIEYNKAKKDREINKRIQESIDALD